SDAAQPTRKVVAAISGKVRNNGRRRPARPPDAWIPICILADRLRGSLAGESSRKVTVRAPRIQGGQRSCANLHRCCGSAPAPSSALVQRALDTFQYGQ